tara:strand:+ start:1663 stop:2199 length:537 start_codon:yes stop_codon:yes gene_type:complete
MYKIITSSISLLLFSIILMSCSNSNNREKIMNISKLETITQTDLHNLQEIQLYDIISTLKIAKHNLSKLEKKKMDSINIEIIYFEYKNYLHCVNSIYEANQEIDELNNTLLINLNQLQDLKNDYINSKLKRIDLNNYFFEEMKIVQATSKKVNLTLDAIRKEINQFNYLNKKIEQFVN